MSEYPESPTLDPDGLEAQVMYHKAQIRAGTRKEINNAIRWLLEKLPASQAELELRRVRGGLPDEVKAWFDDALATAQKAT